MTPKSRCLQLAFLALALGGCAADECTKQPAACITCGGTSNGGIDGNNNLIVVGAENDSAPANVGNIVRPLRDGRIDSLRISSSRRTY